MSLWGESEVGRGGGGDWLTRRRSYHTNSSRRHYDLCLSSRAHISAGLACRVEEEAFHLLGDRIALAYALWSASVFDSGVQVLLKELCSWCQQGQLSQPVQLVCRQWRKQMCLFPRGAILRLRRCLPVSDTLFSPVAHCRPASGQGAISAQPAGGGDTLHFCADREPKAEEVAGLWTVCSSPAPRGQQGPKLYHFDGRQPGYGPF